MPLPELDALYRDADQRRPMIPIVAAGGADPTVLEAFSRAAGCGWIEPILAGRDAEIRQLADEQGISLDGFRILDSSQPAVAAVEEIHRGGAKMLVKGQIATPT